jgi:hypothetical protein
MTLNLYQGNLNNLQLVDPCSVSLEPLSQYPIIRTNSDSRLGWQSITIQETENIKTSIDTRNEFFLQLVVSYPRVCMLGPWMTNVFSLVSNPMETATPIPVPTTKSYSISTEWIVIIIIAGLVTLTTLLLVVFKLKRTPKEPEIPKIIEIESSEDHDATIRPFEPRGIHRWSLPSLSHLDREHSIRSLQTPSSQFEPSTIDIPITEDAVYRAIDKDTMEQGLETLVRGLKRLDQGLVQLDIGLSKLNEMSSQETSLVIAEAFREQLTNPPDGWETKSVES